MTPRPTAVPERFVYAGMAICITLMTSLLWMPALLGALSQGYGLEARSLSYLAFAELLGFLIGTFYTSTKTLAELKRWVLIGCATSIAANLALLLFAPAVPFLAARPIAGFGAGIGFGYGLKLCSASARPTRNFGIFTALMSLMMIVGFQAVAYLIEVRGMVGASPEPHRIAQVAKIVFGIYAVLAGIAACILMTNVPPSIGPTGAGEPLARGRLEVPVMTCLLAIVVSFAAQGAIWAFLQTLGISHGFSISGVANAMSMFAVMGVVGSLVAAMLPSRVPRWMAVGTGVLVLWVGLYALYAPASLAWYIGGCAVGGFYWNFMLPLVLGLLARIDPSGRGSVLGGTMSSGGSAVGPLLAGLLIHGADYEAVGWLAGALCTAGLFFVWLVERSPANALLLRPQ